MRNLGKRNPLCLLLLLSHSLSIDNLLPKRILRSLVSVPRSNTLCCAMQIQFALGRGDRYPTIAIVMVDTITNKDTLIHPERLSAFFVNEGFRATRA